MSVFSVNEGASATYEAVIRDGDGVAIGSSDLTTLTLTLFNLIDNAIINGRDNQNALNANNVTLDASGNLIWQLQPEDNVILDTTLIEGESERHVARFYWTWGTGKESSHEFYVDVKQLDLVGEQDTGYYGTVEEGNAYFAASLHADAWEDGTTALRLKALKQATRMIDRLNFRGAKTDSDQILQFPRGGDTVIPKDIRYATYEIALKLLDGVLVDAEVDNIGVVSEGYASVRTNYNRDFVLEHIAAGIPSYTAWTYLRPYVRSPGVVHFNRVS